MQGAGGVGGLLEVVYYGAATTNCFVAFDGNGNVAALVNAADGKNVANYEYGPFGENIRTTGPMAKCNPFRWSAKYQDDESDLIYYGYRYFNASTGRWLGRDPIGERGGLNLYGFVRNNPISLFDYLGFAGKKCTEAIGKNGQPRIVFDPSPPKGGWKAYIDFKIDEQGSAQAQMLGAIGVHWEASVAVLCSCCGIKHGTRVLDETETANASVYDPTQLPMTPFPVAANLAEIVGGVFADTILGSVSGGAFVPQVQEAANDITRALYALLRRMPKNPWDGTWKDGKSPCS